MPAPSADAVRAPRALVRDVFKGQRRRLTREPKDCELDLLAILVTNVCFEPKQITYGTRHGRMAGAIRTILADGPGEIAEAEVEAAAAKAAGRTTGMDHFVSRRRALLDAALANARPLGPPRRVTPSAPIVEAPRGMPRQDKRSAWHGSARLMAWEVAMILRSCGMKRVSFVKKSPAVMIVHQLLAKAGVSVSPRQVGDVLHEWQKVGK